MALLSLTLLGGFEARAGSKVVSLPRKAQALLAYLALDPSSTPSRAKLAALLWSDASDQDARNNLRQVLFRTRHALGRASRVLSIDGDVVGLDLEAVDSDVATLHRLVADGSDQALRTAASLCCGTLLEGCDVAEPVFEEWRLFRPRVAIDSHDPACMKIDFVRALWSYPASLCDEADLPTEQSSA